VVVRGADSAGHGGVIGRVSGDRPGQAGDRRCRLGTIRMWPLTWTVIGV
jgi:hypothetical protein